MEAFTASEAAESAFVASCIALVLELFPETRFCAVARAWESASRVAPSATCPAESSSSFCASAIAFSNEVRAFLVSNAVLLSSTVFAAEVMASACSCISLLCLVILRARDSRTVWARDAEHSVAILLESSCPPCSTLLFSFANVPASATWLSVSFCKPDAFCIALLRTSLASEYLPCAFLHIAIASVFF